jgi:hypothetical protein
MISLFIDVENTLTSEVEVFLHQISNTPQVIDRNHAEDGGFLKQNQSVNQVGHGRAPARHPDTNGKYMSAAILPADRNTCQAHRLASETRRYRAFLDLPCDSKDFYATGRGPPGLQ